MAGLLTPIWSGSSTPSVAPAPSTSATTLIQTPVTSTVAPASGVIVHDFGYLNLAASLTASQAYRLIAGSSAQPAQIGVQMPYPGSIIALAWYSNAAKTAGTAVFAPFLTPASSTTAIVVVGANGTWATGTSFGIQTWPSSTYVFGAGDVLDVRTNTSSTYLPTTADVQLLLYVTFDASNQ